MHVGHIRLNMLDTIFIIWRGILSIEIKIGYFCTESHAVKSERE